MAFSTMSRVSSCGSWRIWVRVVVISLALLINQNYHINLYDELDLLSSCKFFPRKVFCGFGRLKGEFQSAGFIHDGLVDYREINYPDKQKDKLLTEILEVIHTLEGLPECNEYRCKLQRQKHQPQT
jgi:hypothetical protein